MARKLGIDFSSLFPGKVVNIAGIPVDIKPLGLVKIASVLRRIKEFGPAFSERGVTWDNYNTPSSLLEIADILLVSAPNIIEEITDIDAGDIQQLPIDTVVELLTVAVEVNTASKEKLEKNLKSLAGSLNLIQEEKQTRKKDLQK